MTDWVVSSHATSYAQSKPVGNSGNKIKVHDLIEIPSGTNIYFYTREGTPLLVKTAWPLFHASMDSSKIESVKSGAVQVLRGGQMVCNYSIVGDDTWVDKQGSASGIFKAGDRFSTETWLLTAAGGFDLKFLFANIRPGDGLIWLACRSWA